MSKIVVVQPARSSELVVGVEQGARYVLTNADGSRAVINDPTDLDHVGFLTEPPSGIDSPEVRASGEDFPEADGGINGPTYYGRRPWTLSGIIDPTPNAVLDYTDIPTEAARNLVPNPDFETDLTGWSANSGATLARITNAPTTVASGAASLRIIRNADGAGAATIYAQSNRFEGVAGLSQVYVGGSFFKDGAVRLQLVALFYDDSDALVGGQVVVIDSNTAGNWANLRTFVPQPVDVPATASGMRLRVAAVNVAEAVRIYGDAIGVYNVAPPGDVGYFDGDSYTDAAGGYLTTWTGTVDASPSVLYTVERRYNPAGQIANRRASRLQRAWRALRGDVRLEWTAAGGIDVFLTGRLATKPSIAQRLPKTFQVGFMAAERRILSRALQSAGPVAATGAITARNAGNTTAPATVTLTGPYTNPALSNAQTGEVIYLDSDGGLVMGTNDVLVVDLAAKTIMLNGQDRYSKRRFPGSSWWELAPLDNVLQVTGGGTGAVWRVDWRHAWE